MSEFSNLVSVSWLAERVSNHDLVILDASVGKTPDAIIPRAVRFDFGRDICDKASALPNTMPDAAYFQERARSFGINRNSIVVCYDNRGMYSSARAWWMLKAMGHTAVWVLDGGLPAWQAAGHAVVDHYRQPAVTGDFEASYQASAFVGSETVLAAITDKRSHIVDARSPSRFSGAEKDPRPAVRSGHIPTSVNIHYAALLRDGHMRNTRDLTRVFDSAIPASADNIVFSCGSGVTACILALAATEIGLADISVYDGSWSEWGAGDFPIAT